VRIWNEHFADLMSLKIEADGTVSEFPRVSPRPGVPQVSFVAKTQYDLCTATGQLKRLELRRVRLVVVHLPSAGFCGNESMDYPRLIIVAEYVRILPLSSRKRIKNYL